MKTGTFVNTNNGLGVGKLISVNEKVGKVSFFHSITQRDEKDYSLDKLTRDYLHPHTRVYVQIEENHWKTGRIIDWEIQDDKTIKYQVQFPNKHFEYYSEGDLEVRCLEPITEPAEVLAFGGIETQFFHDRRKPVIDMLIELRAASQSMTALLSSSIEFLPHQIEVVRRVLEDPLQRYLLADDVGMGKTIEAGIIIRQCLLDEPSSQIAILVPPHLVNQWQHELADKFRIQHLSSSVLVLPYAQAVFVQDKNLDMLVIDEAHHVVAQPKKVEVQVEISKAIRQLIKTQALASKKLLLLSATPILGHEEIMLAMLKLLDADTYHLEDLSTFKEKVDKRQEYGRLLLGLRPDTDELQQKAEQAYKLFADDAIVTDLATQLIKSVQKENLVQTSQLCHQLRSVIADTYRIHPRVIRTRRSDTQGWEFMPRGPQILDENPINLSHVRVEIDEDKRLPILIDLLEQWREASQSALFESPIKEILLARRYIRLFEALGCGADEFASALDQLDETQSEEESMEEAEIIAAMRTTLAESAGHFDRYAVAIQCLIQLRKVIQQSKQKSPIKIIVFSSSSIDAQCLYQRLIAVFAQSEVYALLTESVLSEKALTSLLAYQFGSDNKAWLLVCDRRGEEGQNLHFADAILHLDLPFSSTHIEQRIGRLDRFGRKLSVIRHRVLLPSDEDNSPWLAWYELLAQGFQIFNRSVSDMQFLLEKIEKKLILQFYRLGMQGLMNRMDSIQSQLQAERERLDEQYALDQITMGTKGKNLFNAIETAEEDEETIKQAINVWLLEVLKFSRHSIPQNKEPFGLHKEPFCLHWNPHTLIPRSPWKSLFQASLDSPLTYRRHIAVRQRDVDLIRCGSHLVEVLEQLFRWDDRGTVFATWRVDPAWVNKSIWMGFRLCYVVHADLQPFKGALSENENLKGLQRRADGFLPPWTVTLHIDSNLEEVSDSHILSILERLYQDKPSTTGGVSRDFNLGSRLDALYSVIEPSLFTLKCRQARDISERRLRENPVFQERLNKAITVANTQIKHCNARLQQRQEAQQRELSQNQVLDVNHDMALNEILLQSIKKPLVRLDAIGFFVISGSPPPSVPV
jgi:ATP-dependent helicase HepA